MRTWPWIGVVLLCAGAGACGEPEESEAMVALGESESEVECADGEHAGCAEDTYEGGAECCRDDDNKPPKCEHAKADPYILWPPNHMFHKIEIKGVTDPDPHDKVTIQVIKICQDQKVDGPGNPHTPDASGIGQDAAHVRAERFGNDKTGRKYFIKLKATDKKGKKCFGTVKVCVPHDQGAHDTCEGGEPRYDSTVPGDQACNMN